MSDVMKQVVQEILQGDKKLISGEKKPSTKKPEPKPPIKDIKRPNYQQLKKDQRLSFTTKDSKSSTNQPEKGEHKSSVSPLPKQLNDDSISKLSSISLVQGNVPKKSNTVSYNHNRAKKKSRIIGNTRNGGCVWFFPELPMELMGSFQRSLNSVGVGVVKMPECLPSYIVLINEVIRNNQDVKFHLSWNKEGEGPFTAELYHDDVDGLEKIMHDMYQKLNRRSLKQYETYTAVSPSPWLSRQMKISPSVEAIAVLEGISYYTSIILMDSLMKNFEDNDFNYEINRNYILLEGNYHVISKLIAELKKEAARLISSDVMI